MRLVIVGAGGVGGYFGVRLALGGADVHFVARGRHLEAMQSEGLRIVGPEPMHLPIVSATSDPASIGHADMVLLCVKLWDTEAALRDIRPIVGPSTAIVSFQNGVVKDDLLRAAFGASRTMGGVSYIAATIESPGVIRQTGAMQRLIFGEFDGTASARAQALLAACQAGGIRAELSGDITRETWQKFVFLAAVSGVTATTRRSIGAVRGHSQTRAFLLDVMREVVAVGRAHGVALPEDYATTQLAFIDTLAPEVTSSMARDLERGNRLEVPWLAGGVVALAAAKGVPTPLNRAIADILALHADGGSAQTPIRP
jgi:2-dehydropantoate 2-reductase